MNWCIAPCQNTPGFDRLRHGPRVTLGGLFMMPGETCTAKEIYAYYRACRLVALKRDTVMARPEGTLNKERSPFFPQKSHTFLRNGRTLF